MAVEGVTEHMLSGYYESLIKSALEGPEDVGRINCGHFVVQ
jgi:hypothetical protein